MSDLISRQAAIDAAALSAAEWDGMYVQDINGRIREALEKLPPAQPEEAIPVAWISAEIGRLRAMGNMFADLTADVITTTVIKWHKEQGDKTPLTAPAPDHMLFDKAEIATQLMMLLPEPRSKDGGEAE